ncbi:hypothetical protein SAMN05446037_1010145 [Anaerovirgula multivorans]|uniref:Uncharacterized protein n=1 Tax=Anaerovirgula multivorans TaxID=312168 RepID=A0A239ERK7_9FIRM|nr:hypothetical protein SAMN05446037_1010145 [Anaerovirgula multivorans]
MLSLLFLHSVKVTDTKSKIWVIYFLCYNISILINLKVLNSSRHLSKEASVFLTASRDETLDLWVLISQSMYIYNNEKLFKTPLHTLEGYGIFILEGRGIGERNK